MSDEIKILGKLTSATTDGILADSNQIKYNDTNIEALLDNVSNLFDNVSSELNNKVKSMEFITNNNINYLRYYIGSDSNTYFSRLLPSMFKYVSGDAVNGTSDYANKAGLYMKYTAVKNGIGQMYHAISPAIADDNYVHTDANFTTELNADLTDSYIWQYTVSCNSDTTTNLCTDVSLKAGDVVEFELKDYLGNTNGWASNVQIQFSKDGTQTADSFYLWSAFSIGTTRVQLTADADTISVNNGAPATVKFAVRKISKLTLLQEFYSKLLNLPVYKLKSIRGSKLFALTTSASSSDVIEALTSYRVTDVDWSTGVISLSTGTNIGDGSALTKDDLINISKNGYFLYDADTKTNLNVNYDGAYFNFVELSRTAANALVTIKSIIIKITDAGVYSVAKSGSSTGIFPYDTGAAMLTLLNNNTSDISTLKTTVNGFDESINNAITVSSEALKTANNTNDSLNNHLENNTNGLNHIPADGYNGLILLWDSEGKAKWKDLSDVLNLEEIYAYGVEWDTNVADPHLTRIGNMSLHKTLPILSLLKGCIAQGDKIIYWLDENDWRFKKENATRLIGVPTGNYIINLLYIKIEITDGNIGPLAVNQYIKYDGNIGKIIAIDYSNNILEIEWDNTVYYNGLEDEGMFLEVGSRLDGYDGTVRIYCPTFYIKSESIDDIRRVWISTYKIDDTWTCLPEILIDAYRSTILNSLPVDMGYLSTLPVLSAISVVNTGKEVRGGDNRSDYDKYLTGADDTDIDIFRSDLGKPRTNLSRPFMRSCSRKAGSLMLSYDLYKNIFYWLYVIEYANFNVKEDYNSELTENGYHQGGLGKGVTILGPTSPNYNNEGPLTPCGYLNELGNGTGIKDMLIQVPDYIYSVYFSSWRYDTTVISGSTKNNSWNITAVKNIDNYAFYQSSDNVWGTISYTISGLTDELKIIFKEGTSNDMNTILEVSEDGTYNVDWESYGSSYNKFIYFTEIQDNCNITIDCTRNTYLTSTYNYFISVPRWRGFDNPFGDIWTNLDGVLIDSDLNAHDGVYVYTCLDSSKFADILNDSYERISTIIPYTNGYIKEFGLENNANIIPKSYGATSTTYKCNYYDIINQIPFCTVMVGGYSNLATDSGLCRLSFSATAVTVSSITAGFRTVSSSVSFPDSE